VAAPIRIELLNGTVIAGERRLSLSARQIEVLSVLAIRRRVVPSEAIVSAVWPGKDSGCALAVLKVIVHKLRRMVGDREFIRSAPAGYGLGATVLTDLDELETLAVRMRGVLAVTPAQLAELRDAFSRLTAGGAVYRPEPLAKRLRVLTMYVGERLGAYALHAGDPSEALALADHLVALDSCDESAWEIAIRAHVALRDHSSAIRAYRRYAQALSNELGIAPSAHMLGILDDPLARTATIA
jgi:DNA-binding SARP family transcriptional activator